MTYVSPMGNRWPDEWDNPFQNDIELTYEDVDRIKEDEDCVLIGGGTVTLAGNTLTWTSAFYIYSPRAGTFITVAANNITIPDGSHLYFTPSTRPIPTESSSFGAGTTVPPTAVWCGTRSGTDMIFRSRSAMVAADEIVVDSSGFSNTLNGLSDAQSCFDALDLALTGSASPADGAIPVYINSTPTVLGESIWIITDDELSCYKAVNDANPQLRLGSNDSNELHLQAVYNSGTQVLDYALLSTDNGDIVLNPAGNVGVKTETPYGLFHIDSSTGAAEMLRISRNSITKGLRLLNYDGTTGITGFKMQVSTDLSAWNDSITMKLTGDVSVGGADLSGTPAVGKLTVKSSAAGNIFVGRNSSEVNTFTVNEDGKGYFADKVGIGDINPISPLSIHSSYDDIVKLRTSDDNSIYMSWYNSANQRQGFLGFTSSLSKFNITVEQDQDIVISGGNIGLGWNSPPEILSILRTSSSSITTGLYLKNAATLGGGIGIDFDNTSTDSVQARIHSERLDAGSFKTALRFCTSNASGTLNTNTTINDLGYLGVGETSPETMTEWTGPTPYLTLHNNTEEDIDGGRESIIQFFGEQSGGEETTLAKILVDHNGSSDDEKGRFRLYVNDGADGDNPSLALTIDDTLTATFAGDIKLNNAVQAITTETLSHYVNIKDSTGATVKVAIVS